MSSSSSDDYRMYRRLFPVHDAVELGDLEALTRMLRPRKVDAGLTTPVIAGEGAIEEISNNSVIKDGDAEDHEQDAPGRDDDGDYGFHVHVDLEERDAEGATPLHVALLHRKLDAARLLLEAGAGTTKRLEGSTPAHIALSVASIRRHRAFGNAALKLLLEHHHDATVKDDRGQTLLHLAASFGLDDTIETLLEAPGGVELLDSKERLHHRPLHLSAIGGHASSTEALIAAGCDTSCSNLQGNTALHLACSKARWGVARLLLDRGNANASAHNKNKQTPAELALKQGFHIPDSLPELQPAAVGKADNGVVTTHDDGSASHEKSISTNGDSNGNGKSNKPQEGDSSAEKRDVTVDPSMEGEREWGTRTGVEGGHSALPRTALLHHPLCLRHFSCPPIRRSSDPPPENVKRLEVIYNEDSGVLRSDEFASLDWDGNPSRAQLADVLRVHDFSYVQKLERLCTNIPNRPNELKQLDGDTAVSHNSFEAAMRAAGAVCDAIDRVVSGRNRNAFCAVRPPGHHAGPRGLVTCGNDMHGSHGFCLLNNVAIGAAYARCVHRHTGIDKVAIIDFDVHHGNGTEEIVKALVPRVEEAKIHSPFCSGVLQKLTYSPWLNPEDPEKCLFVSVHGYGKKERGYSATGWFYPGSGETTCCSIPEPEKDDRQGVEGGNGSSAAVMDMDDGSKEERAAGVGLAAQREAKQPLVLDVGMSLPDSDDTPGASRHRWRDVYRKEILPKLAKFNPDLILVSAGFDAHKKDSINYGYIGLLEEDYEWITQQLVQVANKCCQGRMVSVLEGGYRIQGGIVSAFGRSVAGHVRALVDGCESRQEWSAADAASESDFEQRLLQERERKRKMRLEQQLQALRDRETQLKTGVVQQHGGDNLLPSAKDSGNGAAHGVDYGVPVGEYGKEHPPGSAESAAGAATEAAERETENKGEKGGEGKPQGEKVEGIDNAPQQEGDGLLPSKRRRFNVDYVALQKKLQEEETAKKKGHDGETTGTETMPVGKG